MGKAKNLTEQWKAKMEQKRKERAAHLVSVPVLFAGFEGRAHRLNLMEWAGAGRLPQYLTTAMFEAVQGKIITVEEKPDEQLTDAERAERFRFQCEAFCSMMDEPRFTTAIQDGDAIFYPVFLTEFPEVVAAAINWQVSGCPDIPIQTESGETDVNSLKKFRRKRRQPTTAQSSFNREGVWWDTRPSIRAI